MCAQWLLLSFLRSYNQFLFVFSYFVSVRRYVCIVVPIDVRKTIDFTDYLQLNLIVVFRYVQFFLVFFLVAHAREHQFFHSIELGAAAVWM